MIRFTLRQLHYFVATAEHGSTARAAEALHVSQPSVSTAIARLESLLEVQLFLRRPAQALALTPAGRRKLAEARRLLARAAVFDAGGEDGEGALQGVLELGVFTTLGPVLVPRLLAAFERRHPGVDVQLREGDLTALKAWLRDGVVELALLYDLDIDDGLACTVLGEQQPYALLPAGHPLAQRRAVSLAALAAEPFILMDLPHSREMLLAPFRARGLEPRVRHRSGSLEMVRALVANGLGVSVLATRPPSDRSYDGRRLAVRPIREPVPPHRLLLASSREAVASPAAAAFVAVAGSGSAA